MYSAFGIDHGEISKAAGAHAAQDVGLLKRVFRRPPKLGKLGGGRGGRATAAQVRTAGTGPVVPGSERGVRGALNRAGEADISIKGIGGGVARGATRTGTFMQRHPGLTGTAALGGGGAGGYMLMNRESRPRKKSEE
jgi:hypothetical protein